MVENVIQYIARWIIRCLKESYRCAECIDETMKVQDTTPSLSLLEIKDMGDLFVLPKIIRRICKVAEQVLR